jgi:hypothetical protein
MLFTEDALGKNFRWTCDCGWESEYIPYTFDNYRNPQPPRCPRCGQSGQDNDVNFIPASAIFTEGDGPKK